MRLNKRLTDKEIEDLRAVGYMRVSRKYGVISRIDRPDWRKHMLETQDSSDFGPDFYRRVVSKDKLEIDPQDALKFECSNRSVEYRPLLWEDQTEV